MKAASLLFLFCVAVAGQAPEKTKVIQFNSSDRDHCRTAMIQGRSLREMAYEGTSVAVGEATATDDGYFRVFVLVRQTGPGKTEVKPARFSVIDSDAAHTRFSFYDKAAEVIARKRQFAAHQTVGLEDLYTGRRVVSSGPPQSNGSSKAAKLGRMRKPDPNEVNGRADAVIQQGRGVGTRMPPAELYLTRSTIRQGSFAQGFVYFKKPRRSKVHVGPGDSLKEIDIPVGGVVFRFD